jgi:hypothetical protein
MEPHRKEPKAPTPCPEEKPRRFRVVKLEERIAPTAYISRTLHNPNGGGRLQ